MTQTPPESDPSTNVEQRNDGSIAGGMQSSVGDNNTQTQDNRRWYSFFISNPIKTIIKKPISIAIAAITAVVGTIGIIFAGKQNSITIYGNVDGESTVANELTIYKGDPPEVRQRKLEEAKRLIAEEVLTNITNLDARLGFVGQALADDRFDERLRAAREQVSPALNQAFDPSYRRLMRQQEIASLRGAFASRPLSDLGASLMQVLSEGNADPELVKTFYSNLTEVQDVSESLLQELSTAAAQTSTDPRETQHYQKRVQLAVARLLNRSQIAYLSGLMVLNSLKVVLPEAQERLQTLQHLEPRHLISQDEAALLLAAQLEEAQRLVTERTAIVQEAESFRDDALAQYTQLSDELTIKPSDSWNMVVAKAISLRQLGNTAEAVAAFSRYGEMFAKTDPTAAQYARTAEQFTLQLNTLGLQGGAYIYEIAQGGVADRSGLEVGDIVVKYGDETIASVEDMSAALQATATNTIELTYLRMSPSGIFQRQIVTVNPGPLRANLMPI